MLAGTAISFLGFLCLEHVTATSFNVMGNANKLLTLVLNSLIWDQHASLQVRSDDAQVEEEEGGVRGGSEGGKGGEGKAGGGGG